LSFGPGETKENTWFHRIKISQGRRIYTDYPILFIKLHLSDFFVFKFFCVDLPARASQWRAGLREPARRLAGGSAAQISSYSSCILIRPASCSIF
jgi:hypothetical protein